MTEIPRNRRDPELSQIYSHLEKFLEPLSAELDAADEYTRQRELTETELETAQDIFLNHKLPAPLQVFLLHQRGSLQPDLEDMTDLQSEIAAIHVVIDAFDIIYGFYRAEDGTYYTDRSVQSHKGMDQYPREVLERLGEIAREELAPGDSENLFYGNIRLSLITGEVKPSKDELLALAQLVERLT